MAFTVRVAACRCLIGGLDPLGIVNEAQGTVQQLRRSDQRESLSYSDCRQMGGQGYQPFESLSPQQWANCYRQMANSAFLKAQYLKSLEEQAEYFRSAGAWHDLADEIERISERTNTVGLPQTVVRA